MDEIARDVCCLHEHGVWRTKADILSRNIIDPCCDRIYPIAFAIGKEIFIGFRFESIEHAEGMINESILNCEPFMVENHGLGKVYFGIEDRKREM